MFSKVRTKIQLLMRMTALRQALKLIFVFLFVVLIAGISAIYLISREIDIRIDAELSERHRERSEKLAISKSEPEVFSRFGNQFEAFQNKNGKVVGTHPKNIFDVRGFSNLDIASGHDSSDHDDEKDDWRIYVAPSAGGVLAVGTNLDDRDEYLEIVFKVFVVTGGLILSITLLGGLFFGLRAQKRISEISGKLQLVADGDLSVRIGQSSANDDFDLVSVTIDKTTAKLEILVRQIRDLTTNIAHDLKTPLTRLRGQLETLEGQVSDRANLDNALEQTDQIIEIFEALLRIARLESGQQKSQFEHVDLGELAQQISDIYGAVIEDSGRVFHLKVLSPDKIEGDRTLLVQMMANLIENSLKHTPANTEITLSVENSCLALIDTGPGIPEDQYDRVLEPMYRLETSRSTPGSGLGLAMVNAIANLHNGKVMLSKNPERAPNNPGLMIGIEFSSSLAKVAN